MSLLRSTGDVIGFLLISMLIIIRSVALALVPKKFRMKAIAGEIALVTGGGSGLGRLVSMRLAELGAIVVVWDVNAQGLDETIQMIRERGGTCYGYVCDLCNREDVYKQASCLTKEVGRVSILVNNAGVVTGRKFLDSTDQMLIRTMDVNIMSHFWTVKAFLPAMLKENKGHIVSIASLAGHVGCAKLVDYATSKFAAVGFDEALRAELEAEGYDIKTTVICPFFIRSTGMFNNIMSRFVSILKPEEVADRVITAMRCNDEYAIIPGYLQVLLAAKWMFPRQCANMLMRALVHDFSPNTATNLATVPLATSLNGIKQTSSEEPNREMSNGSVLHQHLTRRISNSERKP